MSDDHIDYFVCPHCKTPSTIDRWDPNDIGDDDEDESMMTGPDELICPECCRVAKIPDRMEGPIPVQACLFCEGKGVVK